MAISLLLFPVASALNPARWGLLVFLQFNLFSAGTPEASLLCTKVRLCNEQDPPPRRCCVGELFTQAPFLLILL